MTFHFLYFHIFIVSLTLFPFTQSKLTTNYYQKSCPKFNEIIQNAVTDKQISTPTTAAATLRLFFHDCWIEGCDASVLIATNTFNKAERDGDINLSLAGDGFDIVTRAKTTLELECPGIVSCSDILATATRDLVKMVGGPFYKVRLGRKDGLVSKYEGIDVSFPLPTMSLSKIISYFTAKNFTIQEMVALSGAHTIGFSHCKEFSDRLFHFSKTKETDPTFHPEYAKGLRDLCANYTKDPSMAAFNDVMTPGKFDNMYYLNLQRGLGLLSSDAALWVDERTKPFVKMYAANQTKFFEDFARAMEKISLYKVKTGNQGEVRHRCDSFNDLKT
ncbi:Peroxidase [Quillaja saponaria]|uniref:Peroxidase n=1 Tax=Quillaja saponaria TaxID=32244 RepID=A0AAD7KQ25_QUISA|nr:Peroxidase [Quillaja saponaria]